MKIVKEFEVESAHIVRNCTSARCSHSIHGHSAKIEICLESDALDNAQMVYDFGLLKGTVKSFVDSMDHCYLLCDKDCDEFKSFINKECDRYIILPFNPSAEMLSIFIHHYVQRILDNTITANGEGRINVRWVRYHETRTGYAESSAEDVERLWKDEWEGQILFSEDVITDWGEDLRGFITQGRYMKNPMIKQQIKL